MAFSNLSQRLYDNWGPGEQIKSLLFKFFTLLKARIKVYNYVEKAHFPSELIIWAKFYEKTSNLWPSSVILTLSQNSCVMYILSLIYIPSFMYLAEKVLYRIRMLSEQTDRRIEDKHIAHYQYKT